MYLEDIYKEAIRESNENMDEREVSFMAKEKTTGYVDRVTTCFINYDYNRSFRMNSQKKNYYR